uniref:(northern house mosquito) hypothetical protein n=1 Tax=Culex pipiens TaxID=7175 RepID=A0A8D8ATI8_CULPI
MWEAKFRVPSMMKKEHQRSQILVLILEVTLPAGYEVRRVGSKQRSQEDPLERIFALVDLLQQRPYHLRILQTPIPRHPYRNIQHIMELPHHANLVIPILHLPVVVYSGLYRQRHRQLRRGRLPTLDTSGYHRVQVVNHVPATLARLESTSLQLPERLLEEHLEYVLHLPLIQNQSRKSGITAEEQLF